MSEDDRILVTRGESLNAPELPPIPSGYVRKAIRIEAPGAVDGVTGNLTYRWFVRDERREPGFGEPTQ